jgi:protein-tyrosine phosphatase
MAETAPEFLFVCLGNICRSPLAEGIFLHHVALRRLSYRADSAGLGDWHVGELADPRSRAVAKKHGVSLVSRARQVSREDFHRFEILLAMDRQNLKDLRALCPTENHHKIRLMREFDSEGGEDSEVPDPYYGDAAGFDRVFAMLNRSCLGLLEYLEKQG